MTSEIEADETSKTEEEVDAVVVEIVVWLIMGLQWKAMISKPIMANVIFLLNRLSIFLYLLLFTCKSLSLGLVYRCGLVAMG